MRIGIISILLSVFGGLLAANLIIDDRTLSSIELENARTVCPTCHGLVPDYDHPSKVHNKHAAFGCSSCHSDNGAAKTADNLRNGLERLGMGTMLFGLAGIIANVLVVNRKGRAN